MASMGPERKAPENSSTPTQISSARRCFNGAGAKGSGKLDVFKEFTLRIGDASMGPERKAPENEGGPSGENQGTMLQWGRSERLRKTFFLYFKRLLHRCFNGAGAKGSGKHFLLYPYIRITTVLQWGRSERLRKTQEVAREKDRADRASMGPERKAPENV